MNDLEPKPSISRSQWKLIFLILAVSAGSVMYRLIVRGRLEQTAVLFVGIPTVLAILLAMVPKAKTVKGGIMKGLTLFLLLSGPLLGEGFICILMASPIFYLVGLLVGAIVDWNREKRQTTLSCLLLILLPMSIEGSSPRLSFNREETVQASQVVYGSEQDVQIALSHSPRTETPVPIYGRMGFPLPTRSMGRRPGSWRHPHDSFCWWRGQTWRPSAQGERIHVPGMFDLTRYLTTASSHTGWTGSRRKSNGRRLDAQHVRVTWTLHFERRLDPAWYFRPWERYATHLAAEYLIRANATPAPQKQGE